MNNKQNHLKMLFGDNFKTGSYLLNYFWRKNHKKGVVLCYKDNMDNVKFGWSVCNEKDEFDKYTGICQAALRSVPLTKVNLEEIPHTIRPLCQEMVTRSKKYFRVGPYKNRPSMRESTEGK